MDSPTDQERRLIECGIAGLEAMCSLLDSETVSVFNEARSLALVYISKRVGKIHNERLLADGIVLRGTAKGIGLKTDVGPANDTFGFELGEPSEISRSAYLGQLIANKNARCGNRWWRKLINLPGQVDIYKTLVFCKAGGDAMTDWMRRESTALPL